MHHGGNDMRTRRRFVHELVSGIAMFICMAGVLANPADSQAAAYSILHNFIGGTGDGYEPYYGAPVLCGSTLFGMTQGGGRYTTSGTLYRLNTSGTGYQVPHWFNAEDGIPADGTVPRGGLTLSGSTLYGCTAYGGPGIGGTVFKMNTDGSGYQQLCNFAPPGQANPVGAPLIAGSTLYGTTSSEASGAGVYGAIFALSTGGGTPQILRNFAGKPDDGANPYGALTLVGSRLYGMTANGGHNGIDGGGAGYGVIFAIDMDGNNYQVLHEFAGYPTDGAHPYGALTLVGSKLYGMTSEGGPIGGGVLFELNPADNSFKVLFDFGSGNVSGPRGSLILSGSRFYGMVRQGGSTPGAGGVIFQINTDGTGFQILHNFMPLAGDGGQPLGDLTLSQSGNTLYGSTYGGGSGNGGVVFSYQIPQSDPAIMQLLLME
jgi:uncharacterized repeat protein (TIGR03803 family)